MRILGEFGKEDLAKVYVASMKEGNGYLVEFVESLQPPIPREKKWVLIVSSSFGCPVNCRMCDAGGHYRGKLTSDEILQQIDYMVRRRFPDGRIPIPKLKVQFARMGEPSLNPKVLDVLRTLPEVYDAPGLMPCISTLAPIAGDNFFEELIDIKNSLYSGGRFQLQFSIHTTDKRKRDELMPVRKWGFPEISEYGERYYRTGDRKVTLNFAMARGYPVNPEVIAKHFDASKFFIKITPLNPTSKVNTKRLESAVDPYDEKSCQGIIKGFQDVGFDVLLSIGELEENKIGSNCGQFVSIIKKEGYVVRSDYETSRYAIMLAEIPLNQEQKKSNSQ
ncbi:MAG: radical SAM protein [Thermoplasmata archaeon]